MESLAVDAVRLSEVCERYGVASLELFGSTARGDDGPGSDIDLLFVLKPDATLGFGLFDLEDELSDVFGRPVDLVRRSAVSTHIRDRVYAEARPFYAA